MPEVLVGGAGGDVAAAETRARAADARLLRRTRWRLALWSGGATLLVLVLLGAAIYFAVRDSMASTAIAQLVERAQVVEEFFENGRGPGEVSLDLAFGGRGSGTFAYLALDPKDTSRIYRPARFDPPTGPLLPSLQSAWEVGRDLREAVADGVPWRFLSLRFETNGTPYVVQVVQDRSAEQRALDTLLTVLIGGGLVALLGAVLVGAVYAQRALVPIRRSLAAQRAAIQRQREFAADASHELRTPLTVVRSSVEHLRHHADQPVREVGSALDDIDAEVGQLSTLVDDLLLLARADSGAMDVSFQPVELGDLATEASAALSVPAAARDVRVEIDPEPVMVSGDPVRLRQLVTILVDNAVRYSPAGGRVGVSVRRESATAVLTVSDQGPGIAPEDLPRVFDRFWHGKGESGGTGLGLSIAAAIVTRHGGRIGVANRTSGGAAFTVVLPAGA